MTRHLVTGGAGFIGSWLVEHLVERGVEVVVLDDFSTGRRTNLDHVAHRIRLIEGDASDPDTAALACRGVEVVYHQAAIPSVPRSLDDPIGTHRANVTATLVMLDAARRAKVRRFVYAASSSAYGGAPDELPKREDQRPTPLSPYATAKLASEHYCRAFTASFGLETVALRYFNIFGPRQDPDSPYSAVLARFAKLLLAGETPTIYGDGRQTRDFTYVANAIAANWLAAHAPGVAGRVYNIGCGVESSLLDILDVLGRILGRRVTPRFEPRRAGDPERSVADIARARAELGYAPSVDLRTGLEHLLASLRERAAPVAR